MRSCSDTPEKRCGPSVQIVVVTYSVRGSAVRSARLRMAGASSRGWVMVRFGSVWACVATGGVAMIRLVRITAHTARKTDLNMVISGKDLRQSHELCRFGHPPMPMERPRSPLWYSLIAKPGVLKDAIPKYDQMIVIVLRTAY